MVNSAVFCLQQIFAVSGREQSKLDRFDSRSYFRSAFCIRVKVDSNYNDCNTSAILSIAFLEKTYDVTQVTKGIEKDDLEHLWDWK